MLSDWATVDSQAEAPAGRGWLLAVSPPTVPSHGAQRGSARCVRGPLLAGRNSAFTNWFAKNHLFSFETFQVVKITHMEIRFKS